MYFCQEYCGVLHKLKSLGMQQRHMGKWMFSSTHSKVQIYTEVSSQAQSQSGHFGEQRNFMYLLASNDYCRNISKTEPKLLQRSFCVL